MVDEHHDELRSYDGIRSVREAINAEITDGDLYRELSDLHDERSLRRTGTQTPSVVQWEVNRDDSSEYGFKPPEGSVTLFFCASGSDILEDLEYAILTHDLEELDTIADDILDDLGSRSIRSVRDAVGEAADAPAIFDLRYEGQELARNLYLPDMELGGVTFPYNGASLDRSGFGIVEHTAEGVAKSPYDYLVVTAPPKLSELEKNVVESLPTDVTGVDIGGVGPVAVLPTVAAVMATAAAIAATAVALKSSSDFHDQLATVGVSDRFVRQMGVRSSANELLEARREVFEEHLL